MCGSVRMWLFTVAMSLYSIPCTAASVLHVQGQMGGGHVWELVQLQHHIYCFVYANESIMEDN